MTAREDRILVIKLGALGDFVQAMGPFAAIRRHHAKAHLVLLSTAPYEELARASRLFDEIWLDAKPRRLDPAAWLGLRRRLRDGRFKRIYDLQTSDRSGFYFRLLWPGPRPQWSGIAAGCSHPHTNPGRDAMHTVERQAEQLRMAGIKNIPAAKTVLMGKNFKPADGDFLAALGITRPFALLAPGGAAHRPEKRWPAANFAALANHLQAAGVRPVMLGTAAEGQAIEAIIQACPRGLDLSGRTTLADIVHLARAARLAVGNDSGPMHLTAAAGCPSLVLFSSTSDPALCGQRGPRVAILRRDRLAEITPEEAVAALQTLPETPMPA